MTKALSLPEVLRAMPPDALPLVEAVIGAAERRGAAVYLVGGPLRDLLLEREVRDVDLIVEWPKRESQAESPAALIAREAMPEEGRVISHGRFGTVRLESAEAAIDLASARRERYERAGALPVVESGSLEEDLLRRDFSINALAIPLRRQGGSGRVELIDLAHGLRDLEDRRLRVLHARSFHDDPTRALRAARLAARLGFSLARSSASALRGALRDGAFGAVSGDRLRREIEKCFGDAVLGMEPVAALRLLAGWHVLSALEPGFELPRSVLVPLRRLGRSIAEPPWRGSRLRPWVAGLSLWLAPHGPALRRRVLRRFSVRGQVAKRIVAFPESRDQRLGGLGSARGRGAVDALLTGIDEDELYALHASAEPSARRRIVRWAAEDRSRRTLVGGNDLLALGLSGPAVGRALARIRSAHLDGEVANREEAVTLAQELVRRKGAAKAKKKRSGRRPARRAVAKRPKASRKPR